MSRGITGALEREIRSQLSKRVHGEPGTMIFISLGTPSLEREATNYLQDVGALEDLGTGSYRVTAYGREYWEKIAAPRWYWYWFRRNWFAACVAGATIFVSLVAAVANFVNLVVRNL